MVSSMVQASLKMAYTKDKSVESFHKVVSTKVDSAFTLSKKLHLELAAIYVPLLLRRGTHWQRRTNRLRGRK